MIIVTSLNIKINFKSHILIGFGITIFQIFKCRPLIIVTNNLTQRHFITLFLNMLLKRPQQKQGLDEGTFTRSIQSSKQIQPGALIIKMLNRLKVLYFDSFQHCVNPFTC